MDQRFVPPGYSAIRKAQVLGNIIEFVTRDEIDGKMVRATQDGRGVSLKVEECRFSAIAEFQPHPVLTGGLHDPKRWHIGFVQNIVQGSIVYHFGPANGATVTLAAVGPETVPCKDAGSISTWYDPNPALSLKRFGVDNSELDLFPATFPIVHPARTDIMTRHIEMSDAPGTGALPITVPCRQIDPARRAAMGTNYTVGMTDPLGGGAPLQRITGNLVFKTWLVVSSEMNPQRLRGTNLFIYLYSWDWNVNYTATVNGGAVQPQSGAQLLSQSLCAPHESAAILTNPDANASVCVRFM